VEVVSSARAKRRSRRSSTLAVLWRKRSVVTGIVIKSAGEVVALEHHAVAVVRWPPH